MKSNLSQMAVMNVDKGEEIVGEWAHFIQRDDGTKDRVMRGEVNSKDQLDEVIEIANRNLKKLFDVALQATDYDMYTLDGKKASNKKQ